MSNLQQFDQLKADITLKLRPSLEIKVSDDDSKNRALMAGSEAARYRKMIEEKRKELVKPLKDEAKAIDDYAKSLSQPVVEVESHLKAQLAGFEKILAEKRRAEEERLAEERRKREKEIEEKARADRERAELEASFGLKTSDDLVRDEIVSKTEQERQAVELNQEMKSKSKAIAADKVSGARKRWVWAVKDLSKVPVEFLQINSVAVNQAMREGNMQIPGIEYTEETTVAFR